MTSDARQKCRNLRYAITYSVIWANQKSNLNLLSNNGYAHLQRLTSFSRASDVLLISVVILTLTYTHVFRLPKLTDIRFPIVNAHTRARNNQQTYLHCSEIGRRTVKFFTAQVLWPGTRSKSRTLD